MDKFAFIIHPLDTEDMSRKYSLASKFPKPWVEKIMTLLPPVKASYITGVKSKYSQVEGWFIGCTLTAKQMITLPTEQVIKKIIQSGKLAEKMGAKIVGLGAMTSVVGDAGITIANSLKIPVTTGNSYTVATAVEGVKKAAKIMGMDLKKAKVTIVGATGAIGAVCAQLLARDVRDMNLVARNHLKLENLAKKLIYEYGLAVNITSNLNKVLPQSDIIIAVTGSAEAVIEPHEIKPGAIICDVARPRDVSKQVAEVRDDVLVIEGGVVEVPGDVEFNLDFGFPPKTSYACMAETMILTLEKRFESFTLGRELTVNQVEEISRLAAKHGFKLAGFRSFERAVSDEHITSIKKRAGEKLRRLNPISTM
ncbi:MAG: shikimate dehydrogenase [Clostridia bacterium]|nr:shikimate dehydrogenase [Clostridia bacterium]